jgi:predicted component of type VI protein secretion system
MSPQKLQQLRELVDALRHLVELADRLPPSAALSDSIRKLAQHRDLLDAIIERAASTAH